MSAYHKVYPDVSGSIRTGLGFPEAKDGVMVPAPSRTRKSRVSSFRRSELMKIPCYFCGDKPETVDHLLPRSRGGSNRSKNLVSSCSTCNSMKSGMMYDEFIAHCHDLIAGNRAYRSLKKALRYQQHRAQAEKVLAWHQKRTSIAQATSS